MITNWRAYVSDVETRTAFNVRWHPSQTLTFAFSSHTGICRGGSTAEPNHKTCSSPSQFLTQINRPLTHSVTRRSSPDVIVKRCLASVISMAIPPKPRNRNDFEIAIICALPLEANAVEALFDKSWDGEAYGKAPGDRNTYTLGVVGSHNVVLAYMPRMGKASAATVTTSLRSSFQQINLALAIGICGGVPNGADQEKEILLGDVIIGTGLVQYDYGRRFDHGFIRKSAPGLDLSMPNDEIQGFLNKLSGQRLRLRLREKTANYLTALYEERRLESAKHLGAGEDRLFEATYRHKHHNFPTCYLCTRCTTKEDQVCKEALELSCADLKCDANKQVARYRLRSDIEIVDAPGEEVAAVQTSMNVHEPVIHFGLIASGDTVMKSGEERDMIAAIEKVIAFEMEGAGIWNNFPCLVIKGVCDYADAHKNKKWQGYAAATAAACARAVLEEWTTSDKSGKSLPPSSE
jgi:nucleoside phosphorylase